MSEFTGLHGGLKSTYVLLVGNLPHWEKRLYFHSYTPYWKGMEWYKEGP